MISGEFVLKIRCKWSTETLIVLYSFHLYWQVCSSWFSCFGSSWRQRCLFGGREDVQIRWCWEGCKLLLCTLCLVLDNITPHLLPFLDPLEYKVSLGSYMVCNMDLADSSWNFDFKNLFSESKENQYWVISWCKACLANCLLEQIWDMTKSPCLGFLILST